MNLLLTPARLDLLFKASPLGIVPVDRQTRADLNALEADGLLGRDREGILHLTPAGRQCMDSNMLGTRQRPHPGASRA
jgi:hypothetical protein